MPGPPASTIRLEISAMFRELEWKTPIFYRRAVPKLQTHRRYRPRCRGSTRPAARRSTAARRRCRAGCGSRSTPRSSSAARTVRPRPAPVKIAPFVCPILVSVLYGAFVWARGVFDKGLCGGSWPGQGRGCSRRAARFRWTWSLATRKVKFTGLAQNLGRLQASNMDFQSNCWANLRILGQPSAFQARAGRSGTLTRSAPSPRPATTDAGDPGISPRPRACFRRESLSMTAAVPSTVTHRTHRRPVGSGRG
jgi:hypothetical protein